MRKVIGILALVGVQSCDPCFGVVGCTQSPALHVDGTILDPLTATRAAGTSVKVVLRTGMPDSATTTTDATGFFEITIPASATGALTYDLTISPPNESTYVATDQVCVISGQRGSGCPLGTLTSRAYFPFTGQVLYRDSDDFEPDAEVVFRRTGGVPIYGARAVQGTYRDTSDAGGFVPLLGFDVYTTRADELVGDVVVKLPPPLDSSVLRDFTLKATTLFRPAEFIVAIPVGPSLAHTWELFRGTPSNPAANVGVRFTRTGGIPSAVQADTGTTDASGRVVLMMRPLERGEVVGDLTITPPAPQPSFTIQGIRLQTHDTDLRPLARSIDINAPAKPPA